MFDKKLARQIHNELLEAAEKIAKKYGMTAGQKGGSVSETDFTAKVVFELPAKAESKKLDSTIASKVLGLDPSLVGKSFKHKTKTLTITEINLNRPKNPISLKDQNGKAFKCGIDFLKSCKIC